MSTQINSCQNINGVDAKKIYTINIEQLNSVIDNYSDDDKTDLLQNINKLFNMKLTNRQSLRFNTPKLIKIIKEKYNENQTEIKEIFGENIIHEEYEFNIEELINNEDIYLVSAAFLLPDKLLDNGIHSFSTKYLCANVNTEKNCPKNNHYVTRLSIHSYTNDKVYPTRSNWENHRYLIIVKLNDIKDSIYSNHWQDTISLYGVDYKQKEIHIILPDYDKDSYARLRTWLNEEQIHTYIPCEDKDTSIDNTIYLSSDKTKCKTSRDMSNEVLNNIFIKLNKKLLKKYIVEEDAKDRNYKFLLYNPHNNNIECYVNQVNLKYTDLNEADGDGNIFESEDDINILKKITNNTFFGLHEDTTNFTLNTEGIESKLDLLRPLFYIIRIEEQNTYNNQRKLIDNNIIMKNMIVKIKNNICDYLNISIDFAYDLYILMTNLLINDEKSTFKSKNVNFIFKFSIINLLEDKNYNEEPYTSIRNLIIKINELFDIHDSKEKIKEIILDFQILFNMDKIKSQIEDKGEELITKIKQIFTKYNDLPGDLSSYSKYLKYKTKYLNLKKSLNIN
jgi:hypothetical protein